MSLREVDQLYSEAKFALESAFTGYNFESRFEFTLSERFDYELLNDIDYPGFYKIAITRMIVIRK